MKGFPRPDLRNVSWSATALDSPASQAPIIHGYVANGSFEQSAPRLEVVCGSGAFPRAARHARRDDWGVNSRVTREHRPERRKGSGAERSNAQLERNGAQPA